MAGLCAPLSTLRQYPHGHLRMTRGRCGSLLLHRDGLAPSTPCRSPGALRFTPERRQVGHPAMSVSCRFCCKSQLRQAANRDSVVLTRFSARSIHDGPFEEHDAPAFIAFVETLIRVEF